MLYWQRFLWWLSAFWQRYARIILFTSILVIGVVYVTSKFHIFPKQGVKIAIVGRFNTGQLPNEISSKISYGLTRNLNGRIIPGIARRWEIGDDGKTYTFYLNDLKWHDGSTVTTNDIKLKIKNAKLIPIDKKTLKIKLSAPFVPLPSFLTKPIFKTGLIGVGGYKVVDLKTNKDNQLEYIVLEQTTNPINLLDSRITYIFYPSYEMARTAFLRGEVNVLPNLISAEELKNFPNIKITNLTNKNKYVGVFLNLANPYLSDKKFRQALAYATYKFDSKFERTISPLHPNSRFFNPNINSYDYNLAKAEKLFQKTSIASQEGQIIINLVTPPDFLDLADRIKKDWQKLSRKIVVKTHVSYELNPDFDALIKIQNIPPDPDQYYMWHSTQSTNITHLNSPRIDQF
ncbi:MAG: hypothetical protein GXP43_02895 [bacterium]|nr:hypothetical protein [bacterium]